MKELGPQWWEWIPVARSVISARAPILLRGHDRCANELAARLIHGFGVRKDRLADSFVQLGAASATPAEVDRWLSEDPMAPMARSPHRTLFIEEIGELAGSAQIRLLSWLDRGDLVRMEGLRLTMSSTQDLQTLVLAGRFLDDLLYRITTIALDVPPLVHPTSDVALSAQRLIELLRSTPRGPA